MKGFLATRGIFDFVAHFRISEFWDSYWLYNLQLVCAIENLQIGINRQINGLYNDVDDGSSKWKILITSLRQNIKCRLVFITTLYCIHSRWQLRCIAMALCNPFFACLSAWQFPNSPEWAWTFSKVTIILLEYWWLIISSMSFFTLKYNYCYINYVM